MCAAGAGSNVKDYFLNRLTVWLWYTIVLFIVLLAVYTSSGRLLMSNVAQYREDIVREVNARFGFELEMDRLKGSWSSLTPSIELGGVRILGDAHAPVALEVERVVLEFDVLDSLSSGTLQLYALEASGIRLHADLGPGGQLQVPGVPATPGGNVGTPLQRFVFNTEVMQLDDVTLVVHDDAGVREVFIETGLRRDGNFRRFRMSFLSPTRDSWFRMIAEGTGELDDIANFHGDLHLQSSVGELEFYADLLSQWGLEPLDGQLDTELWLGMRDGKVQVGAEINATEMALRSIEDTDRVFEVEEMEATLRADYADGGWRFGARDLELRADARELRIDRLSGEYGAGALILRTEDVDIARVTGYLARENLLNEGSRKLLATLSPRGHLDLVQLRLEDLQDLSQWRLAANFRDLDIEPWRGAPGLDNATGYANLSAREGRVQLQSSDFSMAFPKLFRTPLSYSAFSAELGWRLWDDAFHLTSGPFTGQGAEGEVRGLFALEFPLVESSVGVEMDLLVGLADSRARFRRKYLPYTLAQNLRDWLDASIGEGELEEAGFLYRGSLRKQATQHRTVQLFFEMENTALDYHPEWPTLRDLDALVVIDDANADVLGRRARMLDSDVRDIIVELRQDANKHLQLGVAAQVSGGAADGLEVVNNSPLREMVGDSFVGWQLSGDLVTDMELRLDLTDPTVPPDVAVATDWSAVRIDTGSIGIAVENVEGRLLFDSDSGFSASGMKGTLWGEPVLADVSQAVDGDGLGELDIAMRSRVDMASLRSWLDLDMLRFASGASDMEMHILVAPAGEARLRLSSSLAGVALDLPPPWSKAEPQERALNLEMPLAKTSRRLLLDLNREIYLGVLLDESGYRGVSLGLGTRLPGEEAGLVLVGGSVKHLDWERWSAFLDNYLPQEDETYAGALLLGVRDLHVDELSVFGQQFDDVVLDARQQTDSWLVDVTTDWLRGRISLPPDLSRADISVDRLDIDGLTQGLDGDLDSLNPTGLELPVLQVNIVELYRGEDLWGDLSFELRDDGPDFRFSNIRGNLQGLQLGYEEGLQLDWLGVGKDAQTRLRGTLAFLDFGEVLVEYQYDRIIETNSGRVHLDLAWPGSPNEFELARTSGTLTLDVDDGRFLNTSAGTAGTLRVVGILNLTEIVRRLSLDLRYVFRSGVPFDSITGELIFQEGMVDVPQVDVAGRSSRFQFVGVANIPEETVDGELVATLPIASNLPWVAALISGLPAAAGVYVISKLFTKQLDRFSSAVYRVEGPWGDPQVNFQRIFDSTATDQTLQADGSEAADPTLEDPSPET